MEHTLRAGIIGCGKIAINHADTLRDFPGASLVAVCDSDVDRAKEFAREYGTERVFSDAERMLAECGLDVVHICTPHPSHEGLVLAAARAGVHALCEKPLAVDVAAADRMIAAAEDAGIKLGTVFQRRYWPAARRIRAAIDDGTLGTPILGDCTVLITKDRAYFEEDEWRGRWSTDGGGVLMNQAIHYLDLLQWYLGTAVRVSGRIATLRHAGYIEVEDTAVATVEFEGGALATIRASTAAVPSLGYRVSVTGDAGGTVSLIESPIGGPGVADVWAVAGAEEYHMPWGAEIESHPPQPEVHRSLKPYHALQVRDFLDAVVEDRRPEIDGIEGRKSLALVQAVYESSRTGRTVTL
ncbi:Gfo/Idh/MocA family protein [Prauserella cavernicola]|uniref:Gfo/Idh/MocA family oxidoreductase n=1 Tax=Prauserella cavernicola TaxID=2800127 RepID=A0A934QW44_9PSEU|nr:Gfo/Idh/MocA family oxidoreductase [Prauserella cavernicola]MBK1787471.1 Gfo/Idh/MocA family oxidoreductase [Prauserella cavernicola]